MIKKYILASINIYILIITSLIYMIGIITINLYPTHNFYITLILATLTTITILCYLNKKNQIYNTGIILTIIFNVITIYNINDLNQKYSYIDNIMSQKYEYNTYNIYVQKKNPKYNKLDKLNNKKIGMLKNNSENICNLLNKEITITCYYYNKLEDLASSLESGEIQSIILSTYQTEQLEKSNIQIKKKIRIIKKITIKDTKF